MRTTCRLALVSLALAMTVGGCVQSASGEPLYRPAATGDESRAIRFENGGRDFVHVYLIGERREWLLGRVEPGAVATLRIPDESLGERDGFVRLAVLTGQRVTLRAARDPRARFTVAQPAAAMLSQRWMFSQGELTSVGRSH